MKLEKFLSLKEICSRKEAKKIIKKGLVKYNGNIINKTVTLKENDEIFINDINYIYNEMIYILMNKPKGYVCANGDQYNKTIFELLSKEDFQTDLFTVGRLDKDTTGLIFITNDGKFSHELISGKKDHKKTYLVKLKNSISDESIAKLERGVYILDGYKTKQSFVKRLNHDTIELTMTEGKYHQVKEMAKAVGNKVIDLKRIQIKNIRLTNQLKEGEYKKFSEKIFFNTNKKI